MAGETTLVLVKPDARQRNLVGTILTRIEQAGLTLDRIRTVQSTEELLAAHYEHLTEEEFYPSLVEYMMEPPGVFALEVSGENAVERMDVLSGDTEPASADPGTIRGDFADDSYEEADAEGRAVRNLVHASGDSEEADRELDLWFPER